MNIELSPSSESNWIKTCLWGCGHCRYNAPAETLRDHRLTQIQRGVFYRVQEVLKKIWEPYNLFLNWDVSLLSDDERPIDFSLHPWTISLWLPDLNLTWDVHDLNKYLDDLLRAFLSNIMNILCNLFWKSSVDLSISFAIKDFDHKLLVDSNRGETYINFISLFWAFVYLSLRDYVKDLDINLNHNFVSGKEFSFLAFNKWELLDKLESILKIVHRLINEKGFSFLIWEVDRWDKRVYPPRNMLRSFAFCDSNEWRCLSVSSRFTQLYDIHDMPPSITDPTISIYPDWVHVWHHTWNINNRKLFFTHEEFLECLEKFSQSAHEVRDLFLFLLQEIDNK